MNMDSQIHTTRAQRKKNRQYVLVLCLIGLLINFLLAHLATGLKLPLFLDNIGNALAAALGGYIPGVVVGFFSNVVNGIGDLNTIYYGCLTIMISVVSAWFAERDYYNFRKPLRLVVVILVFALIGGGFGSVLTWTLYGFEFGSGISAPLAIRIYETGAFSKFWSQFTADMLIDLLDKTITVLTVAAVLTLMPERLKKLFYL